MPLRSVDFVAARGNAVIPAKAGIQVLEIVVVFNCWDARFSGHDELRHNLCVGEGQGDGCQVNSLSIGSIVRCRNREWIILPSPPLPRPEDANDAISLELLWNAAGFSLREAMASSKELARRLDEMERRIAKSR